MLHVAASLLEYLIDYFIRVFQSCLKFFFLVVFWEGWGICHCGLCLLNN